MSKLSEQVEQLEQKLKQSNREYEELRELYIAERWELIEVKGERDTLAYENKNLAGFIKYNDKTITDSDVGDIATSTWTDDVWDRFIDTGSQYLLGNNIEQRETIRELRRKLTRIENICNDMNEDN